jgi:hypothetical protein
MAGYSGTPLAKKLGLKPGQRVALLGAPPGYEQALAPPEGAVLLAQARGPLDLSSCSSPAGPNWPSACRG